MTYPLNTVQCFEYLLSQQERGEIEIARSTEDMLLAVIGHAKEDNQRFQDYIKRQYERAERGIC